MCCTNRKRRAAFSKKTSSHLSRGSTDFWVKPGCFETPVCSPPDSSSVPCSAAAYNSEPTTEWRWLRCLVKEICCHIPPITTARYTRRAPHGLEGRAPVRLTPQLYPAVTPETQSLQSVRLEGSRGDTIQKLLWERAVRPQRVLAAKAAVRPDNNAPSPHR